MFRCDVHEPPQIWMAINSTWPAVVEDLNGHGYADYLWDTVSGKKKQIERKQWGEVLAGMDSIEDQLRREKDAHPEVDTALLIEGTLMPVHNGVQIMREAKNGILVAGRRSPISYQAIYAWIYNLEKYLEVYHTPNLEGTIAALGAFYANDQKDDSQHKTFQRHFKKVTFNPNPQVTMLMGLLPGIGEVRAKALIKEFTTVWNVLSASPEVLVAAEGIGIVTAKEVLRRIGRPDIKD